MAKMNELMEKMRDEAFAKKFEGCKSAEDFVEVAKKEGYDITVDDIENGLELSDEDMVKVAGGGWGFIEVPKAIIKIIKQYL